MSRFRRSWLLFTRSVCVIADNKRLLWFPLISGIFTFAILLFFLAPLALGSTGHDITDPGHWQAAMGRLVIVQEDHDMRGLTPLGLAVAGVFYLASMVLATFFNVAFYHEILSALNGNSVSIARGLRMALAKIRQILMWSVFAGVVGFTIKTLERRFGLMGKITMRLIGMAWSVAAIFAIPVIIREDKSLNPLHYLKTSAIMLKRTWGESIIGYLGMGLACSLCVMFALGVLSIPLTLGLFLKNIWLIVAGVVIAAIGLFVTAYLLQIISHIYRCALFVYASEGVVPEPFDQDMMELAWKVKK